MPSNHKMHIFFLYCLMGSKRIENVCFGFSHSLPFGNSYECGTYSEQVCKMLFFFFFSHGRPHRHLPTSSFLAASSYPPCWHLTLILGSLWQTVEVVTFSLASTRTSLMTCLPTAFCLPRLFKMSCVLSLLASGCSRFGKRNNIFLQCVLSMGYYVFLLFLLYFYFSITLPRKG